MNDHVDSILKNSNFHKWRGSFVDAQNYINNNSNKMNKFLYPNVINFVSNDCLYIVDEKASPIILCIYLTEHLISYQPTEGYATIDLLYTSSLNYELVACAPKYKYRTFDNKSVEFLYLNEENNLLLDSKFITMGLYCERYGGGDRDLLLSSMISLLDNVRVLFDTSLFIPYIIHPYRLILFKNNNLKLLSCNLLQYILCPYIKEKKLCDVLYIHPSTIENDKTNTFGTRAFLKKCTISIILDFFHSFFVTIVWILLCENKQDLSNNRNFCNGLFKDYKIMLNHVNNKSRKKLAKDFSIKAAEEQETNTVMEIEGCKNAFGYCQINRFDENEKKLIHEYGCQKLTIMPVALNIILDREDSDTTIVQLKELVDKDFVDLRQFVSTFIES